MNSSAAIPHAVLLVAVLTAGGFVAAQAGDSGLPQARASIEATHQLLTRLLPRPADRFVLESIPRDPAGDVFEIQSRAGRIVLRGNNGVSLASALNWYLKHHCHWHVSWCGSQLNRPEEQWCHRSDIHPTAPPGHPVTTAQRLLVKYEPAIRKSLGNTQTACGWCELRASVCSRLS